MVFSFDFKDGVELSLAPESYEQTVRQEMYIILNTPINECPMYRGFGTDQTYRDMPTDVAQTLLVSAMAAAMNDYMPDLVAENVEFDTDTDNPQKLMPTITITSSTGGDEANE